MNKNKFQSVSFVPRLASVHWSKQVTPINSQQSYRNNTNHWIPNEKQRSLHSSPLFFNNTESPSNDQFTAMPQISEERRVESRDARFLHLSDSEHSFPSLNSHGKDVHDHQNRKSSKAWLIFSAIWHTVVSFTVMLISIYLLLITPGIRTTVATTTAADQLPFNQTNSSVTMKQPYICSGVSPYTLWTLFVTVGITMTISTSSCSFNSTPLYFTSLAGLGSHWNVAGYGAIYSPTKNAFIIYTQPLTAYNNVLMLNYSQVFQWDVNWFGILE